MREGGYDISQYYGQTVETAEPACLFCSRPKLGGHNKGCPVLAPDSADLLSGIQPEFLTEYVERSPFGPKVGETTVIQKETGQVEKVSVTFDPYSGIQPRFVLVSAEGEQLAYIELEVLDTGKLEQLRDIKVEEGIVENPKKNYGDVVPDRRPRVFVDEMKSRGRGLKGLGLRCHEIAVERSFQVGAGGRVQLMVGSIESGMGYTQLSPGTSAPFHESFGFKGQTVRFVDGSVHYDGSAIHDKIQKGREQVFALNQRLREYHAQKGELEKAEAYNIPLEKVHARADFWEEADKPYMYLPEEVIHREEKRVQSSPILLANQKTIAALEAKHTYLASMENRLEKSKQTYHSYLASPDLVRSEQWESVADSLMGEGASELGNAAYALAAASYERDAQGRNGAYFYGQAGEMYQKIGNEKKARECFNKALFYGENAGADQTEIESYLVGSGDEARARALYRDY